MLKASIDREDKNCRNLIKVWIALEAMWFACGRMTSIDNIVNS